MKWQPIPKRLDSRSVTHGKKDCWERRENSVGSRGLDNRVTQILCTLTDHTLMMVFMGDSGEVTK